nr:hypothetical protein [Tissierella sp.]
MEDFLIGLLTGIGIMIASIFIIFASSDYLSTSPTDFKLYFEDRLVDGLIKSDDKFYISAQEISEILGYNIELGELEGRIYLEKEESLAKKDAIVVVEEDVPKEETTEITKIVKDEIESDVWEAKKDRSVILVKAINKSLEAKKKLQAQAKKDLTVDEAFDVLIDKTGEDPEKLFYFKDIEDIKNGVENKYYDFAYSKDGSDKISGDMYYSVDKTTGNINIVTSKAKEESKPSSQWQGKKP